MLTNYINANLKDTSRFGTRFPSQRYKMTDENFFMEWLMEIS